MIKERSGKKFKKEVFPEIRDTMQAIWSRDAQARAPFIHMEAVTMEPDLYTNYTNTVVSGDTVYAVKKGYIDTPKLVSIDSEGNEKLMTHLPHEVSNLRVHDGKIYWSEDKPDERWSMKSDSRIL